MPNVKGVLKSQAVNVLCRSGNVNDAE